MIIQARLVGMVSKAMHTFSSQQLHKLHHQMEAGLLNTRRVQLTILRIRMRNQGSLRDMMHLAVNSTL